MSEILKMYNLQPSPNSMKVRIALAYKKIPHEKVPVDPQDRSEVVKISGQPLTPVIVHGDRVLFDSGAILRYLEANWRDTPRLFSSDYATMREIEKWEAFGRTELLKPVGITFGQLFATEKDPAKSELASRLLNEATARIEERLEKADWLVGNGMTAADVTAAPPVFYGMLPAEAAASSQVAKFFAEHLELGPGRERTRAWALKVMAYDR
jgi:glutathione S-transferase